MEISKGMYIRFNGFISKIGHINTSKKGNTYVQFKQPNGLLAHTRIENIDRASFNIIDLIKVGDYVNGNKVTKLGFDKLLLHCKTIECHQEDLSRGYEGVTFVYTNNDIKDVVTKEQFNACKYVVERNGNNEY